MKRLPFLKMMALVSCVCTFPAMGRAQEPTSAPIQSECSQVINRAFQFARGIPTEFQGIEYRIVVRFLPSFSLPESQIVFLKQDDGAIRVIRYRLKKGARPLSEQCNEMLDKNPQATAEDMLRQVAVDRIEKVADASTVRLVEDLLRLSIPTKFAANLFVADGTTYELWIQTSQNEIHAVFTDVAYGKGADSTPIIRWIKAVQETMMKER